MTGLTECFACPTLTIMPPGADKSSITDCVCEANTYAKYGPGKECVECPSGAVCFGGTAPPHPLPGFWADSECENLGGTKPCVRWDHFIECNPASNCLGGPNFECGEGREGRLCSATKEGYFNVGRIGYYQCGAGGFVSLVIM
eukprot:425763-Rhodomonas_salina.1